MLGNEQIVRAPGVKKKYRITEDIFSPPRLPPTPPPIVALFTRSNLIHGLVRPPDRGTLYPRSTATAAHREVPLARHPFARTAPRRCLHHSDLRAGLLPEELSQIGAQLSNPVVQRYSVDRPTLTTRSRSASCPGSPTTSGRRQGRPSRTPSGSGSAKGRRSPARLKRYSSPICRAGFC